MTEQKVFEHISNLAGDYKCWDNTISHDEALVLYSLLEELKKYRGERRIKSMTEQEAIDGLKNLFSEHELDLPCTDSLKILHIAIEALEKQIEKKPDLWGDGYADGELVYDMYNCPNCGVSYEIEFDKYNYCPKCSQKLDWSEEDEE